LHALPEANLVKLPDEISFETAAGVMLKGLTVQYLLRQTYELKGGETILFHAAAGGVGSLACQWAKALGVKLIGTVSSKAELAKANGAWATIDYSHENVAERVLELTDGKKVPVVYDGVGKDTWLTSLDSVSPRGLVVSFGNASGAVDGVNLGILAAKGSLYVTRPTLATYANNAENLQRMADELFEMIISGKLKVDISQRYSLADAAKAQTELSARRTTGSTILLPDPPSAACQSGLQLPGWQHRSNAFNTSADDTPTVSAPNGQPSRDPAVEPPRGFAAIRLTPPSNRRVRAVRCAARWRRSASAETLVSAAVAICTTRSRPYSRV
jgi:NADPH2:quinone reductase